MLLVLCSSSGGTSKKQSQQTVFTVCACTCPSSVVKQLHHDEAGQNTEVAGINVAACQRPSGVECKAHTAARLASDPMSVAFGSVPRLRVCTLLTQRCRGRAVQWAVNAGQRRSCRSNAIPSACGSATITATLPPMRQRQRQRASHVRCATSSGGNGSGGEDSSQYIITTPLYYVNAGAALAY